MLIVCLWLYSPVSQYLLVRLEFLGKGFLMRRIPCVTLSSDKDDLASLDLIQNFYDMLTSLGRIFIKHEYLVAAVEKSKILRIEHTKVLVDAGHIPTNQLSKLILIDWFSNSRRLPQPYYFFDVEDGVQESCFP